MDPPQPNSCFQLGFPSPLTPWPHSHGDPPALDLQDKPLHELQQFIVETDVEVSQLKMLHLDQLTSTAAASSSNAVTGRGWSQLSCSPAVGPVQSPGPAPLCCSGEVWGCSPMCCSQQGAGPSLSRLWTSTLSQMAVRTRNVCIDFGGNMSHRHRPLLLHGLGLRHGSQ